MVSMKPSGQCWLGIHLLRRLVHKVVCVEREELCLVRFPTLLVGRRVRSQVLRTIQRRCGSLYWWVHLGELLTYRSQQTVWVCLECVVENLF